MSRRVLVSVSDKEGLQDFVKGLLRLDYEIVSTGGTARFLREGGARVTDVSEVTGFPEILGGRVKTLHPKVHGGLLGIREDGEHRRQMREQAIDPIDMLVVNLYPFQQTVARPGATLEEAVEQIDIGGPAMVRSAAKNFRDVAVVVRKEDYGWILQELEARGGTLTLESRFRLGPGGLQPDRALRRGDFKSSFANGSLCRSHSAWFGKRFRAGWALPWKK